MVATINADTTNGVVITSDTSGEIELQANGVTKAKVTANGLQDANGASLRGGSFRNLVINGDMRIAQRGTSTAGVTASGYYAVDHVRSALGSAGTWTVSQDTDVPTGQGFANSVKHQCTTTASMGAANILALQQRFEGQNLQHLKKGTADTQSLTLSFWVKSNKTGTYIAELMDNDNTRSISQSYTISSADTWEKKVLTYAGDTSGSFDNDNNFSMQFYLWFVAGTNYTSGTLNTSWNNMVTANRVVGQTVNLADSTSNYINITGVQLEVGSGASDFEFLPYDVQLARCQRYYQIIRYMYFGAITTSAISNWRAMLTYSSEMRTNPTTIYGTITSGFSIVSLLTDTRHLIFESGASARADFRPSVSTTTEIIAEL